VHVPQHHVFEGDAFGVREARPAATGIEKLGNLPFPVDGHQTVADLVGGGVEGDGEEAADLASCAFDLGDDAGGGKRDAAAGEGEALAVHGDPHRVADVVGIVERLAHPHQHDVGDEALLDGSAAPVAEVVAG